jgi:hypothetical protein
VYNEKARLIGGLRRHVDPFLRAYKEETESEMEFIGMKV